MKVSIYNVIFPYDEHIILYNTLHCESMLLDKTLSEFLNGDVNELENLHQSFIKHYLMGILLSMKVLMRLKKLNNFD